MSTVFSSGPSVVAVKNNDRKELILLQDMTGNTALLGHTFIMNFDSSVRADYQLGKSMAKEFIYTTFGDSIITLNLAGYQSSTTEYMDDKGKKERSPGTEDAEKFYMDNCISSSKPKLIKITVGTSGVVTGGTVYKGFMVAFSKKPMGEDKMQGYGFTITFVCERV